MPQLGVPFHFPNISGSSFITGNQPFNPGEPTADLGLTSYHLIPWPRVVGTIMALASDPGTPRNRAIIPDINQYGVFPANYLFLAGTASKSQG